MADPLNIDPIEPQAVPVGSVHQGIETPTMPVPAFPEPAINEPNPEDLEILNRTKKEAEFGKGPSRSREDQQIISELKFKSSGEDPEKWTREFFGDKVDFEATTTGEAIALRFSMNLFGDTQEEQRAVFMDRYPAGELVEVPGTGDLYYRFNGNENFRKLDPGFFDSMGEGLGPFTKELIADAADISGDMPEIVGETAMALLRKRVPFLGPMTSTLTKMSAGGMGGEYAQQMLQTLYGTQLQSYDQQASLVAGAGVESLVGNMFGGFVTATANLVRGRSLTNVTPEGSEAVAAARRIGTKPLIAPQVSDVPLVKMLGGQSKAMVPRIERYLLEQSKRTAEFLRGMANPQMRAGFIQKTAVALEEAGDAMVRIATEAMPRVRSTRGGGRALQKGFDDWWRISGEDVDNLYKAAREFEEPVFNARPAIAAAKDTLNGVQTIDRFGEISTANPPSPDLRSLAEDVTRLVDNPTTVTLPDGTEVGATEYLLTLRRRAYDISQTSAPGIRRNGDQNAALRIAGQLKAVLKSPTNTDPGFVRAWRIANGAAENRFSRREKLAVIEAWNSQKPSRLASSLGQPGQLDNLVLIRRATTPEAWNKFQSSFRGDLLKDPFGLTKRLESFDKETLNLLMPKHHQAAFKALGKNIDRLNGPAFQKALKGQTEIQGFVEATLFSPKGRSMTGAWESLIRDSGGITGELGKSTRAAILEEVWQRAKVTEKGVDLVDVNKLTQVMNLMESKGLLRLLDKGDIQNLKDVRIVSDYARLGNKDAGTSLQAASAAASVRGGLLGGSEFIRGITTILESMTVGRVVVHPLVTRLLTGKLGENPFNPLIPKIVSTALTNVLSGPENQEALGEEARNLLGLGTRISDPFVN